MKKINILIIILLIQLQISSAQLSVITQKGKKTFKIESENYSFEIESEGFRFDIYDHEGRKIAAAHPISGLQFGSVEDVDITLPSDSLQDMTKGRVFNIESTTLVSESENKVVFNVINSIGEKAMLEIHLMENRAKFSVIPEKNELHAIIIRTAPISPVYGLGDHGALGRESAEISGFSSDYMGARTCPDIHREGRLISNFVIHPKRGMAAINVEPRKKIAKFTDFEAAHGSSASREMNAMYYIFGDPKTIYHQLQEIRDEEGHPFYKPKYDLFGVGWEAYGALGWTTSAKTVEENINTYLDLGYPLSWMVIGSGFWPSGSSKLWGTTSFGMWDEEKYPEPEAFLKRMDEKGLTILLGLRIAFRQGNPYAIEAQKKGFLISDEKGEPINFANKGGYPSYLLNFENTDAIDWYVKQCRKWLDSGVDGFKEDLMFYLDKLERDDKCDEVNRRLSESGVIIMLRNNYLGSPGDLHRFNDFNFYESQDRGPINALSLAYSGFPYVYPDIVGGTKVWTEIGKNNVTPELVAKYIMRYAEFAAVHPSMSFGYGPWSLGRKDVVDITRDAALLHERLQPYIYSYALKTAETGFPYTLTPLPLAYPHDPEVYGLANMERRSYQWLLGESLMAVPLYGDDYATANTRDVYLPEGKWIDYDNGKMYSGPVTLREFPLPIGKTPLFVGGKGIVVEEKFGRLFAHVYPIHNNAEMTFYHKDGSSSSIQVQVDSWEENLVQVLDDSENQISYQVDKHRGAIVFPLEKGVDYTVKSIPMPEPVSLVKDK